MNPAATAKPNAPASAPAPTVKDEPIVPTAPAAAPDAPPPDDKEFSRPATSDALPGVFLNRREDTAPEPKAAAPAAPVDPAAAGVITGGAPSTPAAPAAPAAPPAKFRLGDLEFDNEEAAVHSVKTLRGMYRKNQDEVRKRDQQILDLQQRLLQQPPPTTQTPASDAPVPGQPPQAASGQSQAAIDWQVFNILKEKHGVDVAQQWYDGEVQERTRVSTEEAVKAAVAELEKKFQPALDLVQQNQRRAAVSELIDTMRTFRNPDGSEAYPELKDENAAEMLEVRRLWHALGFPQEILYSQRGLHTAIATYRDAKARQARLGGKSTPKPPTVATSTPDPGVATGEGRPSAHPMAPAPAEDIGDRITRANLNWDAELGFAINKR